MGMFPHKAVVAHTGGDGEEVGVRGGPVYVLGDSPGPYVDTEVEEAGIQEEVAERNHRVQLQTGVKTEVFNLSVIILRVSVARQKIRCLSRAQS